MSARPSVPRGLKVMLVAGGIAVLLAGCAAGQVTSTAEIVPVVDGRGNSQHHGFTCHSGSTARGSELG